MNQTSLDAVSCLLEPSNERRWYMVAVVGTSLSLVSLLSNLVIAKVLLSSKESHFFFLALLAISDCFLSLMYGPVIAMDIIKDRLQLLWLTRLYLSYVGPLLSLCQVSMTFSCYLIILATIERYLITHRAKCLQRFRQNRGFMAFLMLAASMLLRGTLYFEIEVQRNGDCDGLTEYIPGLSELVYTPWYGTVFRFYIRNIMTVFIPFFLLALLNYSIVSTLRKQQRSAEMFRFLSSDHKMKIRSATRLMVFVVCSYLLANVLNVLITVWEFVAFQSTQTQEAFHIYEMCTDIISVLYVAACATRLLVYYSCNKEIRDYIRAYCAASVPKSIQEKASMLNRSSDSRNVGTDIDAVAIAIARRLMSMNESFTTKAPTLPEDSPVHAIIYANEYSKDSEYV